MHETSKSVIRRSTDRRFTTRWFVGNGIDIGSGNDPLTQYSSFFPLTKSIKEWDVRNGDAMFMEDVADESYDFVHSSHCLEHMVDPYVALENWIRICKKDGHLVIMFPDEDLYEQGLWPSTFNTDHKHSFTIAKRNSWSPVSINVLYLLNAFADKIQILKIELLDSFYLYGMDRFDQTHTLMGESAIEIILKKS